MRDLALGTICGNWTVISDSVFKLKHNITGRLVKCTCGTEKVVSADFLRREKSTCCNNCKNKNKTLTVTENQQLGDWKVLSGELKGAKIFVECKCGTQAWITKYSLLNGKTKSCYSCGNEKKFKGVNTLSKTYFSKLKKNAEKRSLSFNLTMEELWSLYVNQKQRCALTDKPINLSWSTKESQTASLDRIDSSKEYVIENVQWVHKDINKMKNNFNQNYFVEMCKLVYKHNINGFN